jgi:hypothetical protein
MRTRKPNRTVRSLHKEEAQILINRIRKLTGYMVQGYAGPITMVSQDEVFEIIKGEIYA